MASFTPVQSAFRFYNDDGSETAGTAMAAQNTNVTIAAYSDATLTLRIQINETGGKAGSSVAWALQMAKNAGAFATITTSTTGGSQAFDSTNLTGGNATTNRLTGGNTFLAGLINETGTTGSFALTATHATEFLYTVKLKAANLAPGDVLTFRLTQGGSTFTYSVTPTITVADTRRYLVGLSSTANWDASTTTNWAKTSGGTGGASVPDSTKDVYFDGSSGAGTLTLTTSPSIAAWIVTGFTGSFNGGTSQTVTCSGDVNMGTSTTWSSSGMILKLLNTSAVTQNFWPNTNGSFAFIYQLVIGGTSAQQTVLLQTNLGPASSNTVYGITLNGGTFDANGFNVTATRFTYSNVAASTLLMRSGIWQIGTYGSGTCWDCSSPTGLTLNAGTSKLFSQSSGASITFKLGGFTYYDFELLGGSTVPSLTTYTIEGSNTFHNLTLDDGYETVKFTDGTTTTVASLISNNTSSHPATITGTSTGGWTLSCPSGSVDMNYTTVSYSTATGGATFNAPTLNGNVDGGHNSGWIFISATPIVKAALTFGAFPLGINGKTQTSIIKATLTWAGRVMGINGKSMFPFVAGKVTWAAFVLPVNAKTITAITRATLTWAGRVLGVNAKYMTAINMAPLKFAGFVLPVNAKSMFSFVAGKVTFAGFVLPVTNAPAAISIVAGKITLAGFALAVNAKSMFAFVAGKITYAGFALGANGKQMFAFSKATLTWAGSALAVNAKSMFKFVTGSLTLAGRVLSVNARQMFAFTIAPLVWAGRALGANGKSMITMTRATITFAGQVLGINGKSLITMARATVTFAGQALTVTGLLSIAFAQATITFGGRALNFVGLGIDRFLAMLGIGR